MKLIVLETANGRTFITTKKDYENTLKEVNSWDGEDGRVVEVHSYKNWIEIQHTLNLNSDTGRDEIWYEDEYEPTPPRMIRKGNLYD